MTFAEAQRSFRSIVTFALAGFAGAQLCASPQPAVLTTVREIRGLTPDQAARSQPIDLQGQVTVLSTFKNSFFFMDSTGGISIDRATDTTPVQPGDHVEIEGRTAPGQFAPLVNATAVKVLGKGALPNPRLYEFNELAGGRSDSQRIALRGLVRSASVQPVWGRQVIVLNFDMGVGGAIPVEVHDYPQTGWEKLPGSIVRISGVCGTVFNDRRQFVGIRMFISNLGDVRVEEPAPSDPFDIPAQTFDNLLLFNAAGGTLERVKVRGTVTYAQRGQGFYIQDGQRGLYVKSSQNAPVAVGSPLEVIGYLTPGRYSPTLDEAVYRETGQRQELKPSEASAAQMMIVDKNGFSTAPFDSRLVTIRGRLMRQFRGPAEDQLVLEDGDALFTARLPWTGPTRHPLELGSLLELTGVCVAHFGEAREADSFELLLRSRSDVAVLEHAPWWTAEHTGWVIAGCLLAILLGLGARDLLRRQLDLRTMAMTDPLTGLYNRRSFYRLATPRWQQAQHRGSTFLLFYFDVDMFKEINDSLGHEAGDRALVSVADVLRSSFRGSDIIARMGGDEFAVACDASADLPSIIEQRIQAAVERVNQRERVEYHLSISIGILVCNASFAGLTFADLVAKADALMYERKRERHERAAAERSAAAL